MEKDYFERQFVFSLAWSCAGLMEQDEREKYHKYLESRGAPLPQVQTSKVSIDKETFEVKLFKGDDDEITKDMLSKGELQMYATAIVWGLAKTSGRPLPFIIDTPLARLDEEHRSSLVQEFYPERHQTIILSTDSEINYEYYKKLQPYISNSYVIQYDSREGKTVIQNGYFFNSKGEKIEV